MITMSLKKNKILPRYAYVPLIIMILFNAVTYFGTRLFTGELQHHEMQTTADELIPFSPFFISIYILAYVQWAVGYVMIARDNKPVFTWIVIGELIAKGLAFLCFVFFPTTVVRPEIIGDDIWSRITAYIYAADAPDNLFPSVHCLESWVCFRGAMYLRKPAKWYKYAMLVFTLLVFASTVFVKQHVLLDIAGAIAAVEIGLFASRLILKAKKRVKA